ncbi:hypothetical protein VPNG_08659 [Cytospora leucostoma]|uniref:FAD-binding domain-containing protein n=1 Tax=Cytospora leucostoma TaxID=1230097 RepID=A0A423W3C3_9PEZI|nr:hypothetical protein VPNG_08659 [Cytospora leucostoma]
MARPIRIAISGGGLAGACLIHALIKHPHLDVHIFESAAEFRESGAAVGIARNALTALDLIGPSAAESLKRAGAVPQLGVRFKLGHGPDRGALVDEADSKTENRRLTSIVHRAAFLRELLADIPKERMHASKKLVNVDRPTEEGPITLHFADGSTHECDVLVGADGIHSRVRGLVLGEEDPASHPRNTGFWVIMTLQPYDKAQASLGKEFFDLKDARDFFAISLNRLPSTFGNIPQPALTCLGSGAGMSIEDSLILSTLLGRTATPDEAQIALDVYDRIRRPRTQRIVESSRGTGLIMTGKGEKRLELAWLKPNLLPRWDFIIDFDNEKHRDEALELLETQLKKA